VSNTIKKQMFVSREMSKNESDKQTKNIFMGIVRDYIDNDFLDANNLDNESTPIEISLSDGIKKIIDNKEKKIIFRFDVKKQKNNISRINSVYREKFSIDYHKFSYNSPQNSINSNYSYDCIMHYNESTQESYDSKRGAFYKKGSFREFSNKVEAEKITDFKKIKNYYLLDKKKKSDVTQTNYVSKTPEVEEYYNGILSPTTAETWDNYRTYLFAHQQITDIDKSNNHISYLPQYVNLRMPSIQGVSKDTEDYSSTVNYLFFSETKIGIIPNHDLYIISFINYLYNSNKLVNDFEHYYNNKRQVVKFYPLPLLLDHTISYFDYTSVKEEETNYINTENYSNNFFPTKEMFLDLFNMSTEKKFDILKKKKDTDFIPLYYKVQKYYNNFTSPSQIFFIPYKAGSGMNFIDNQVLPSEKFEYSVSLVGVSLGINCVFSMQSTQPTVFQDFVLDPEKCFSQPIVIEIPFIEKTIASERRTFPAIPEINIYSNEKEPNLLKVFLSNRRSSERPIFLSGQEERRVLNSEDNLENGNANFLSEDFKQYFIYRIEKEAPVTFTNFVDENAKINSLDLPSREFYDIIEYNKKYYYMVRSFNGSFFSNPSNIMEVEIKNEEGVITPIIKTFSFPDRIKEENKFLMSSKSFKQTISLSPAWKQLVFKAISDDLEDTYKNASIEIDSERYPGLQSIYQLNPKFKIRLISKQSGKMIDINVKYRLRINNLLKQK